jgi:hypothetical protein
MAVRRVYKPIWGFGWVGWIASAVLLALVIAQVQGVDIWYQILKVVTAAFGGDAVVAFVAKLTEGSLVLFEVGGGAIEACCVLIALRIASRRSPWWLSAFAVVAGLAYPLLAMSTVMQWFRPATFTGPEDFVLSYKIAMCAGLGLVLLPVLVWSRSVFVAAGLLLAAGCVLVARYDDEPLFSIPVGYSAITPRTLVGHSAILSTCLAWGIIDRRLYRPHDTCSKCGYSRAGLADSAACPECGFEPKLTPTPSPPQAPPPRAPAP